jgi:glycosyltransferase involved in cell wall biosynthesis
LDNDVSVKNKWQIVLGGFDLEERFFQQDKQGNKKEIKVPNFRKTYPRMESILTNQYRTCFNYPNYVKLLKEYDKDVSDITNMPYRRIMSKTKFNACKSNLKIVEAGFKKKAVIASKVLPYGYDLNENNSMLVDSTVNNWYGAIRKLIDEPNLRYDLGEALYETVKDTFHIKNASKERAELYKDLINNKNK